MASKPLESAQARWRVLKRASMGIGQTTSWPRSVGYYWFRMPGRVLPAHVEVATWLHEARDRVGP